jgi:nitrite reductase (NADH) small subunit
MPRSEKRRISFPREELAPGDRKLVMAGKREIAVFNVEGTLYALYNRCPHHRASLIEGPAIGGTCVLSPVGEFEYGMENRILRCPWHKWEFDLTTGECIAPATRARVASYRVEAEGDEIAVYV